MEAGQVEIYLPFPWMVRWRGALFPIPINNISTQRQLFTTTFIISYFSLIAIVVYFFSYKDNPTYYCALLMCSSYLFSFVCCFRQYSYAHWMKCILYHHMNFLSTLPDREDLVLPFYNLATGRVTSLVQMMQIHARLDLVLTHVTARHKEASDHQADYEALLTYQDGSYADAESVKWFLSIILMPYFLWELPKGITMVEMPTVLPVATLS